MAQAAPPHPTPESGPPEVSLVVPVYDGERFLGGTLDRLARWLAGTGLSHEILVVDDGSRDGTPAAIEAARARHPAIRLLRHPTNQGKGTAVRDGLLAARGRLRLFTDADLAYPVESLFAVQHVPGFAFDVEVLYQARRAGLRVLRVPVLYFHQRGRGARRVVRD